jgi:hypothetical protein
MHLLIFRDLLQSSFINLCIISPHIPATDFFTPLSAYLTIGLVCIIAARQRDWMYRRIYVLCKELSIKLEIPEDEFVGYDANQIVDLIQDAMSEMVAVGSKRLAMKVGALSFFFSISRTRTITEKPT